MRTGLAVGAVTLTASWRGALRLGLAVGAAALTACWFAEIEWYVFWPSADWEKFAQSAISPAVPDFLEGFGGAVIGALAGFATGGRGRLLVGALVGIAAVTVVAFVVMPWDVEAEGGAGLILWWTGTTALAAAICAGLVAFVRQVNA